MCYLCRVQSESEPHWASHGAGRGRLWFAELLLYVDDVDEEWEEKWKNSGIAQSHITYQEYGFMWLKTVHIIWSRCST